MLILTINLLGGGGGLREQHVAPRLYAIKPKASISSGHDYHLRGMGSWRLYQHRGLGKGEIGRTGSINIVAIVHHAIKL